MKFCKNIIQSRPLHRNLRALLIVEPQARFSTDDEQLARPKEYIDVATTSKSCVYVERMRKAHI